MRVPWLEGRCVACARMTDLSVGHVIPRAVGGALSSPFECRECNSVLGSTVEARLKDDPAVRFAIEALRGVLPGLSAQMLSRASVLGHDPTTGVRLRARQHADEVRVMPTGQPDGSYAHEPGSAARAIAASLERGGATPHEVNAALDRLDRAPLHEVVALGRGIAARKGTVGDFMPDLAPSVVADPICLVAVAYRFVALIIGKVVFDSRFDDVRSALTGRGERAPSWHVDVMPAQRPYGPWHGLWLSGIRPLRVQVRLFGQLAWDVTFCDVALATTPEITQYQIDLTPPASETIG